MEARAFKQESEATPVVPVGNEAESVPVSGGESGTSGGQRHSLLDTCPVCHGKFLGREPRLLPCLHGFCRACLPPPSRSLSTVELQEKNTAVPLSDTKRLNVIRCPVCRQECMEADVVENIFVMDSAEAPSSTVDGTVQLCMTCSDNTAAVGFCVDCVEYLCPTCVDAHQRVKFTKDHTIRQNPGVSQEVQNVATQRPMFCDVHKQEPLKLFCETCDRLTCRDCQLSTHKDHSYQFLEDAYENHKRHMKSLTLELQEKKNLIDDVSHSINNGLLQIVRDRTSVQDEIKKSISGLILEINRKGKVILDQLEAVTQDHESVLRKQQEDIGYLSRQLDHVINFTKWATANNGGSALLHCKRLILFQIENLLRAKCSNAFVPRSSVRFQCQSSYWASSVQLGSLLIESAPGHQLPAFQASPRQPPHPGPAALGSPPSLAAGTPLNNLAQLQMQVDKLVPHQQPPPQPRPLPWTWNHVVQLPRTAPRPVLGGSSSSSTSSTHTLHPHQGRRMVLPRPGHLGPTGSPSGAGFPPQPLRGLNCHNKPVGVASSSPLYTHITSSPVVSGVSLSHSACTIERTVNQLHSPSSVQGQQISPESTVFSQVERSGDRSQASGTARSAMRKRRRSSPGPVIVIKDEPEDEGFSVKSKAKARLPDSTGENPRRCERLCRVYFAITGLQTVPGAASLTPSVCGNNSLDCEGATGRPTQQVLQSLPRTSGMVGSSARAATEVSAADGKHLRIVFAPKQKINLEMTLSRRANVIF